MVVSAAGEWLVGSAGRLSASPSDITTHQLTRTDGYRRNARIPAAPMIDSRPKIALNGTGLAVAGNSCARPDVPTATGSDCTATRSRAGGACVSARAWISASASGSPLPSTLPILALAAGSLGAGSPEAASPTVPDLSAAAT